MFRDTKYRYIVDAFKINLDKKLSVHIPYYKVWLELLLKDFSMLLKITRLLTHGIAYPQLEELYAIVQGSVKSRNISRFQGGGGGYFPYPIGYHFL